MSNSRPPEGVDVLLHLFGGENHELRDDIPVALAKLFVARGILHIAGDGLRPFGQLLAALPAIEHRDIVAVPERQLDARQRDLAGAADKQDIERHEVPPFLKQWRASVELASVGCATSERTG